MFNSVQSRANKIARMIAEGRYDEAIYALGVTADQVGNGVYNRQPALLKAVSLHYEDLVDLLLSRGADIQATDELDRTVIDFLALNETSLPILDRLMAAGLDINGGATWGKSLLLRAAESHGPSPDYIKALLQRGTRIDAQIMHMTVYRQNAEMMELLLQNGADPNSAQYSDYTSLHLAAARNETAFVELLLKYGADATIKNSEGKMPCELVPDQASVLAMDLRQAAGLPRLLPKPTNWKLTEEFEILQVSEKRAYGKTGYKLTEVFNFHRQTYTVIARDNYSSQETFIVKSFTELDNPRFVAEAIKTFEDLGGTLPEGFDKKSPRGILKKVDMNV